MLVLMPCRFHQDDIDSLVDFPFHSSPIEQLTGTHVIVDATVMKYNAKNTEKTIMAAERKFNEKMEKRYQGLLIKTS